MSAELHEHQVGARFRFTFVKKDGTVLDISNATALVVDFKKPTGSIETRDLELTNDGSDGMAHYVTVAGDLVGQGEWILQGFAAFASGEKHPSNKHRFVVRTNLLDRV